MIMFSDPINTQQWSQESLIFLFGMNLDYTFLVKYLFIQEHLKTKFAHLEWR